MKSSGRERDLTAENAAKPRIRVFLVLVFVLSWPFLVYGFGWFADAGDVLKRYVFSCAGMLMVAVSALITGACFERQGFRDAGWRPGRGRWYLAAFLFCALLWFGPPLAALLLGALELNHDIRRDELVVVILSLSGLSLAAGFGEEFGWRGYLLPRLLPDRRLARGVLVMVGFVWGVWHCAVAVGPLLRAVLDGSGPWPSLLGTTALACARAVAASIALSFIFGAVWLKSGSILLCSFLHGCWIGLRDATSHLVDYPSGFGLIAAIVLLVAWFAANGWLRGYERGVVV